MKKLLSLMVFLLLFVGIFLQGQYVNAAFSDVSASNPYYDAILYSQENSIVKGYEDGSFKPENKINRAEFTKIIINSAYGDYSEEWVSCYQPYAEDLKSCNGSRECSQGVYNSYTTCVEHIQPCYIDYAENVRVKCTNEDGIVNKACEDVYETQYNSCINGEDVYVDFIANNQEALKEYEKFAYYAKYIESLANDYSTCFSDIDHSKWYAKYVCFATVKKIITGYPDGKFYPEKSINFVEAAKITVNGFNYEVTENNKIWYKPYVKALEERKSIPMSIYAFAQEITRGEFAEIVYRLREGITDKDSKTFDELGK